MVETTIKVDAGPTPPEDAPTDALDAVPPAPSQYGPDERKGYVLWEDLTRDAQYQLAVLGFNDAD